MSNIHVWIDTDAGVDDIIALMLACGMKELIIEGISVVGKNTDALNDGYRNIRKILKLSGREDIEVYKGADKPLVHDQIFNSRFPTDCLKDLDLEEADTQECQGLAWDRISDRARQLDGELVLVTLGPLTNIATMIALHPDAVDHIKKINMMGGCLNGGNITPCAEYNVYVDPEAAENVFKSGIRVNMFGLDVTSRTMIEQADIQKFNELKGVKADLLNRLIERHGMPMYLHDCCPIVYLEQPEMFEGKECGIFAETQGSIANGKTCADLWTDYKYEDRHCRAFIDMDKEAFMEYLISIFG